jgi:GalNAc5-diNAcBac-PP-undecaprenol beta-1,3-glucosyltransferase
MKCSVVITTYNRPDYLSLSLESVIKQTVKVSEITIIDDNSSVDYSTVLSKFTDPRIRYLRQPVSGGANVSRNIGVKESSGDVVAFLDDDDIWNSNYIVSHLKAYSSGAEAVVSGFFHMNNPTEIRVNNDSRVTKSSLIKGNKYCGMSGFSCKRNILLKHPFDEELTNGQDWDLFVRLFCDKVKFYNVRSPIFQYRFQSVDGIGAKVRKMNPSNIEKRLGSAKKHRSFLGEHYYKMRVAEQYLTSFKYKKNKFLWVWYAIKATGIATVVTYFYKRIVQKLF